MSKSNLSLVFKSIIWICLAVIIFSPLYISSSLFFPFITTKTFAFQIAVQVMFLAFLLLCLVDENYKIKFNLTLSLILGYLVILVIASLFSGNDFYRSFWSNNERMDGILLLGYLFVFSLVISSFFKTLKDWLYFFDMFILAVLAVSLVSIDQYLALTFPTNWKNHFVPSSNDVRLASTIGNAGYVGGYMVFGFFIAWFLALKRNNLYLKLFYLLVMLLSFFVAIQTQTRGAYLALAFGGLIMMIYLMWFYFNDKYLKISLVVILVGLLLSTAGVFYFKEASLIKNNRILSRVASISLTDGTANNRMVTWKIGWQSFKEKPLLGYGQENFYQGFDKYYHTKNTEEWFDRCHNVICDRAITGGIVGLLGYLAMLLIPFVILLNFYYKKYQNKTQEDNSYKKYLTPIIFNILIISYLIQNFFIFEALVTYIPLMMIISFAGVYGKDFNCKFLSNENFKIALAVFFIIIFIPLLWIFNLKPLYANADFIKVLSSSDNVSLENRISAFNEVIDRGTYGNQEYRRHYINFYERVFFDFVNNPQNQNQDKERVLAYFSDAIEKQVNYQLIENTYAVGNYLLALRFYNLSYVFNPQRLDKSLGLIDETIKLSPNRPQVYYDVAATYYYQANYLRDSDEKEKSADYLVLAVDKFYAGFRKQIDIVRSFNEIVGFLNAVKNINQQETAVTLLSKDKTMTISMIDDLIVNLDEMKLTVDESQYLANKQKLVELIDWLLLANIESDELKKRAEEVKAN